MKRSDFRLFHRLRVRWAEVDAQKIVFNGHYLMYVDTAIADYWRAIGMPYPDALEHHGGDLYVKKASLEYHASARYDDVLDVGLRCSRIGNSSMVFEAGIFRQDELLITGELVYVYADPNTQTSMRVPQELRDTISDFEAGKPMFQVRVGGWDELGADAQLVRTEVFVQEQGIPAEMEWDDADRGCLHAVAYNRFGMALATGRMLEHVPGVAKIGRMAVRRTMRGSGVGRAVLDALMQAARERGYREALLHAQTSAAGFYARAGFTARGPEFEEAGIPHVEMVKVL
ncbi:YbgC/FadM family acyl-CoA thioesterase [Caldimonas thermodepolymerans]|jgi:YbgC/YbaW family acyl-CoA thioester hydrolase|uniref:4-hydroxybenzoyl-CoA thioesterase n=1 Tax=Caldimonas thermodepolymerans TaxID=215580 RepID=A0A2S5T6N2_9BURK|nr:YbgC/FadM family acyl-CoA thioesterase [Caldimonas thermodepolymerans]PPE70640.1 4-hydroxybenzoyl-CoA thioesterase [Caldimonas thermodepolymerans]QPC29980.1 YbgC/FadM family acyl-CoA thioesterase [Caldimonas thermodepolymerans]RDH97598.1 YbgC/YbaW family acyl-CoA thioester hydrolase [Caldimonas thermodepolymerans]TCP10011.1 YbgC/YbaW family acyl-CoA thioester hydrolase [Caldimonas thermodepolymerans]UZG42722.1 YbgC/FadM family acyl-CoA thioesterase [Caldimonas thermodepolymerans]